MTETIVVHINRDVFDFYVGRPSKWGNPWTHKPTGTLAEFVVADRKTAIENYKKWLTGEDFKDVLPEKRQWILNNIHLLRGKRISCWCHPRACHADILALLADGKLVIIDFDKKKTERKKLF